MTGTRRYGNHTPETALGWMQLYASSNGLQNPDRSDYYNAESLAWCFADAHGLDVDPVVVELATVAVREQRQRTADMEAEIEASYTRRAPRTGAGLLARVRAAGGLDAFELLGHAIEAESLVRAGLARWKGARNARRLVPVGVAA